MLYKQSESQKFPTVKVKKESKEVGVLAGKASIFFSTGRSFLYQKHLKPEKEPDSHILVKKERQSRSIKLHFLGKRMGEGLE